MSLGKIIKQYRADHEMSMQAFADKAGVTKAYISMLENGNSNRGKVPIPTIEKYVSFANVMNISVDDLLALSNDYVNISSENRFYNTALLSDEEEKLIQLFRKVPEEDQPLVLGMIQAAVNINN